MQKLSILKARSTWVIVFTVISNITILLGKDIFLDPDQSAGVVLAVIDSVAAAWVYFERMLGKKKLVRPSEENLEISEEK